ncbi:hypothetical protein K470DRAFT_257455 [Piedraia hortae CBS 480.64]|uniref:Uncharacterized protein n=1 Tax=Piedraia hortae CBS 480.64 TaxID=1314780 RepID=A0A6A7C0I8_9PEZI|nr:hypothetical protein K470DRAFT_257455 [Piedraia hortae CBS 480.64]
MPKSEPGVRSDEYFLIHAKRILGLRKARHFAECERDAESISSLIRRQSFDWLPTQRQWDSA